MRFPATRRRHQRGAIGMMAANMLIITLVFGALATDVARIMIVRNELQNAADAAALVGAGALFPATTAPNWANGIAQGTGAVTLNATEGVALVNGQAQAGYWDLSRTKTGLQAQSITPGTNDAPAVQVTISRSTGNNGGGVGMILASLFGVGNIPLQATAVAVVSSPGTVGPGTVVPLAIGKCMFDQYWDSTKNEPRIDPTTQKPYVVSILDSYTGKAAGTCVNGQWTDLTPCPPTKKCQAGASTVRNLITSGNVDPLSISNNISFLDNGVSATLYDALKPLIGTTVFLPVTSQVVPGSSAPIVAFAAFKITGVNKTGTPKSVTGNFVGGAKIPNSGGTGPYYGAYVPPRLAW